MAGVNWRHSANGGSLLENILPNWKSADRGTPVAGLHWWSSSGGIPCMWELKWRFFIMILQLSAKSTKRPIMNQTWVFLSIFIYWAILSRNLHVNILWIIRRSCEFCGNTLQSKINLNVHILRYQTERFKERQSFIRYQNIRNIS